MTRHQSAVNPPELMGNLIPRSFDAGMFLTWLKFYGLLLR
jgi:hypothetical protein